MNVPPESCSVERVLARAAAGQRLALEPDLAQAQAVGMMQHRHDQAVVQGHGDAEIDLAVADDGVGLEAGVHTRVEPQRQRDGLGDEVAQGNLDPFGGEMLVDLGAGRDDPVGADVGTQVDLGSRLLGLRHALGDRFSHPRVGNPLRRQWRRSRPWCAGGL